MNRVDQIVKSSLISLSDTGVRQRLESPNGWLKRPILMLETINQNRFVRSNLKTCQFGAVGECASLSLIGRENVRKDIVVWFSIVSKKTQKLDFNRPIPLSRMWRGA